MWISLGGTLKPSTKKQNEIFFIYTGSFFRTLILANSTLPGHFPSWFPEACLRQKHFPLSPTTQKFVRNKKNVVDIGNLGDMELHVFTSDPALNLQVDQCGSRSPPGILNSLTLWAGNWQSHSFAPCRCLGLHGRAVEKSSNCVVPWECHVWQTT